MDLDGENLVFPLIPQTASLHHDPVGKLVRTFLNVPTTPANSGLGHVFALAPLGRPRLPGTEQEALYGAILL